jgi:alpha-D-ribose 1-methylphosphonate 5-triphosphate diphosphatase PhnM
MRKHPPPKIGFTMNKIAAVKLVARIIVGAGTTTVSNSIIKNNVQPSNVLEQISTAVASVVIGSMASEATKSHTDAKIDSLVDAWNNVKSKEDHATA